MKSKSKTIKATKKVKKPVAPKVAKKLKATEVIEITTNTEELATLKEKFLKASGAYHKYLAKYNKEHKTGRTVIKEIIELHKKGLTNQEIIAKGYNKHTVYSQVRLFKKGSRTEKTIVAQYLPIDVEELEEGDDGSNDN